MILCDTNIFFGYFRGNEKIINELSKIGFPNLALCSITIGEAFYGMKLSEKRKTKELIRHFNIFEIDESASKKFQEIMFDLRSAIEVPDALIAAIALANNLQIFTLNRDDFKIVSDVKLYNPTQKIL